MNKSDIVETFREKLAKQNPWQPYTGPSGGQGWMNAVTGEVRYQENRPAPGEGMPDDHEGDVPTEEDVPDELPEWEADPDELAEYIEEGDRISVQIGNDSFEGVVQDTNASGPDIETDDGTAIHATWEEVTERPAELAPPDGWADGWTDAPEAISELEEGQRVELYDLDTGQYHLGEVDFIGDDGEVMDVRVEGQEAPVAIGDADYAANAVVTAQEDPDFIAGVPDEFEEVDPDLVPDMMQEGDEVALLLEGNEEAVVGIVNEDGKVVWEGEGGKERAFDFDSDAHMSKLEDVWFETPELAPLDDLPYVMEDPLLLGGGLVEMAHPVHGDLSGEAEFNTDPQGHGWLTLQTEEPLEEGQTFSVGAKTWTIEDVYEHNGSEFADVVDEEGNEDTWLQEDVEDQLGEQEVSLTTNPEHPLYYGDHMTGAVDPFEEPTGEEDIKLGDQVLLGGEVYEVDGGVYDEGVFYLEEDAPKQSYEREELLEAADKVYTNESIDPPDDSPDEGWEAPVSVEDDGNVTLKPLKEGYHVYFYDEEAGQMEVGQVGEFTQDNEIELQTGQTLHRADVTGFARDEMQNVAEPANLENGEYIAVTEGSDEFVTEGWVMDVDTYGGTTIDVMTEDNGVVTVNPGQPDVAISDHDPDDIYEPKAFEFDDDGDIVDERPTDEVVEEVTEAVDFSERDADNRLKKGGPSLAKHQKDQLRASLYEQFGAETVDEFYEMKNSWKANSGSHRQAETLERAYKQALDLQSPARDNGGQAPDSRTVKMAEAVAGISQEYFRDVFGESAELARGSSSTAWADFVDQFLADPMRDEYDLSFLASNNHTTNFRDTADKWNAFTAQREVDVESVHSMTDHLFEAGHESELEIGVIGDDQATSIEGIRPGSAGYDTRTTPMQSDIDAWSGELADKFWESMSAASGKINYEDFGPGQMENLKRAVEVFDERGHNLSNSAQTEVSRARNVLKEAGMPPAGAVSEAIDVDDFEGLSDVTDYESGQGVNAEFETDLDGIVEGEIMGVEDGDIIAWEDGDASVTTPHEYVISTDDILDIDEDQLESLQEEAELPSGEEMMESFDGAFTADDLDPAMDVYYTHGGDVKEGTVLSVTDGHVELSGNHGQSEYYDEFEVEEGMVVPEEAVEEEYLGDDWTPIEDTSEVQNIEPGDWVKIEEGVHGYDDNYVQVTDVETSGDVNVDEGTFTGAGAPDPYYFPDEVDAYSSEPPTPGIDDADGSDDDGGDDGVDITSDGVIDHLEGGPTEGVYFDIPDGYDGEGVGEATAYVGGDIIYEDAAGTEHWISPAEVAENAVSVGEPPEDGGGAIESLEDIGLMENEEVTYESADGAATGYVEYVSDDGTVAVQTEEGTLDHVGPEAIHDADLDADGSDDDDDDGWSSVSPASLHDAEPGLFDEFTLSSVPGEGEVEVSVLETPTDPEGPYEVGTAEGEDKRWLVWPGGEVEPV